MYENQLIVEGSAIDTLENLAATCAQLQASLAAPDVVNRQAIEGVRLNLGHVLEGLEHLYSQATKAIIPNC